MTGVGRCKHLVGVGRQHAPHAAHLVFVLVVGRDEECLSVRDDGNLKAHHAGTLPAIGVPGVGRGRLAPQQAERHLLALRARRRPRAGAGSDPARPCTDSCGSDVARTDAGRGEQAETSRGRTRRGSSPSRPPPPRILAQPIERHVQVVTVQLHDSPCSSRRVATRETSRRGHPPAMVRRKAGGSQPRGEAGRLGTLPHRRVPCERLGLGELGRAPRRRVRPDRAGQSPGGAPALR